MPAKLYLLAAVSVALFAGCASHGDTPRKRQEPWRPPADRPEGGIEIGQRKEYPAWAKTFGWFLAPPRDSDEQ